MLEVSLGRIYVPDSTGRCGSGLDSARDEGSQWGVRLPRTVRGVDTSRVGLPELVGKIRIIVHHPALALPHFTPILFLLIPPLKQCRRAIHGHRTKRRLCATGGFYGPMLGVDVLRVHLCMRWDADSQGEAC